MSDPTTAEGWLEKQRLDAMGKLVDGYAARPGELAAFLEKRLAGYIEPAPDPGEGEVAYAYPWFPAVFPRWRGPVVGTSELYSEDRSALSDHPRMPGLVVIGWRVHALSLTRASRSAEWKDGREQARNLCRPVYDRFREAFLGDSWLESRVEELRIGRVEMGDRDRLGNFYEDLASNGNSIVWVHSAAAEIRL